MTHPRNIQRTQQLFADSSAARDTIETMDRTKTPRHGDFRTPQFNMRTSPDVHAKHPSRLVLAELFSATDPGTSSAPTVIVKRKRLVELPSDTMKVAPAASMLDGHASSAVERNASTRPQAEHAPRVYVVRPGAGDVVDAAISSTEVLRISNSASDAALDSTSGEPSTGVRRKRRRRAEPEFKQPGVAVVFRPESSTQALSDNEVREPYPTLTELETHLEQVQASLAALLEKSKEWNFDLHVHTRWAGVESALQELKATMVSPTRVGRPRKVSVRGRHAEL